MILKVFFSTGKILQTFHSKSCDVFIDRFFIIFLKNFYLKSVNFFLRLSMSLLKMILTVNPIFQINNIF